MPSNRSSKQRVYNPPSGQGSYVFDALGFGVIMWQTNIINNGQANTAVLDAIAIPQRCVVVKIAVELSTGGFSQVTDAFNLIKGTGAESGSAGSGQAVQAAGNGVFAVDKAFSATLPVSTSYQVFTYVPDVPEAWWDMGDLMTLRIVTGATVGAHLTTPASGQPSIRVSVMCAAVDPKPLVSSANPTTDF